ncbi:MAG: hypothetical protein HKL86_06330 [Acidimicrobiaceae bacterium]|nr:hypothetical protein [Acidimicrobiaceae bacterium]
MITSTKIQLFAPEFSLEDSERDRLQDALLGLTANPYKQFEGFSEQVRGIASSSDVPQSIRDYVAWRHSVSPSTHPVGYFKNAPIDRELPVFDFDEPVNSKYALKKTFVGEGFLALFAELSGTPAIAYRNVNDGDVFQDIYPKRSMATSQSQKALGAIAFHKDLANHFVRPDFVYMIGMRASKINEVLTTFASNAEVVARFSETELELAKEVRFTTPFDDLTVAGGAVKVGEADNHPLLEGESNLRLFENRTVGLDTEAQNLVDHVVEILHEVQLGVNIQPGDFVITCNNHCVHSKKVLSEDDKEGLRTRWVIKTVNVYARAPHSKHLVEGVPYLVAG